MGKKYYKTEIDRKKPCVNVFVNDFVNDSSFIGTVRGIIQILDYIKDIKESYSKADQTTKIIEVSPKSGISIEDLETTIQSRLDEVGDEVLEMRKKLFKMKLTYDDIIIYDKVILRMMNNKYNSELINDMHKILGILIRKLIGINIVSLVKQNEKSLVGEDNQGIDNLTQAVQLFCVMNLLISKID